MSSDTTAEPVQQRTGFFPEQGVGVSLAVGSFGFAVLVLGLADARVFTPLAAGIFVPVAFGTGAFGLLIGGLWEFRANNVFGGTFAVFYAGFLFATGMILHFFQPAIVASANTLGFNHAFGTWLLLWAAFTAMLSMGAYYINMPAFIAFVLLATGYLLLGLAAILAPGSDATTLTKAGGWVLIADGLTAWYLSWALAVNPLAGNRLPIWPYPYFKKAETTGARVPPAAAAPTT
jgi:uncharacterized protein